ncbi:SDR family oxidoreductase [Prosthecochloris sp.]|uniref:SDR family NAD(P)-dependent oxidoreductase n=1 Tax=Prosthecochloris sp. TaxID=290513 RepID=UPI00257DCBBA|nr:SDR family oxidoreductase [Prosthecochloris sp.]
MNNCKNKTGWITGGGAGVGASLCKILAEHGANVLCTDIDLEAAERVASNIRASGGVCIGMQVDITKEEDNAAAVKRAFDEWGTLHMVGINAAVDFAFGKDVTTCTLDEMRKTTEVNYFGSFLGIKHAAIAMKEHNIQGNILVIGSGASIKATPGTFAYASSKHGLIGIAKVAAVDLLPFGIKVNTACLGMVNTEGLRSALAHFDVNEMPPYADHPDIVAAELATLMSNDSPLMTGQIIGLERGLSNTQYMSAVEEHGSRYAPE